TTPIPAPSVPAPPVTTMPIPAPSVPAPPVTATPIPAAPAPPVTQDAAPSAPAPPVGQPAPAAIDIAMSADAPKWLRENVDWMASVDLGCHFTALLAAFVRAETAFGFDDTTYGKLAVDHRPEEVNKWIKWGRAGRSANIPTIKNVRKFAQDWGQWWEFLQPEWRERQEGNWLAGGDAAYGRDDAWGLLDTPGPNGCLSLIAGLFMWGAAQQDDALKGQWMAAVQDVSWMMEGLAESMNR
ncbi:hypothetical protein B0H16DRAFT_1307572, partial [Mycena metata]